MAPRETAFNGFLLSEMDTADLALSRDSYTTATHMHTGLVHVLHFQPNEKEVGW